MDLAYEWGVKKWSCVCDGMEVRLAIRVSRGRCKEPLAGLTCASGGGGGGGGGGGNCRHCSATA